ncbi:MAG: ABC transporter [Chloroflexi bacterium]|nr:ABC transporter [Chloroflexota bacterium]MBA3739656.1 ABC transporter [Chloroflexota bacterium]
MRPFRMVTPGALLLALILGACTTGEGDQSASPTEGGTSATLASTLRFGGPPECPERPFCLIGLQETYGLEFAEFVPLDVGGPITVEALTNGEVEVALLFTSDPSIQANDFVELEDDQGLQRADNLIPVIRTEVLDASPGIEDLLNALSGALTQEELIALNSRVTVDEEAPDDVAAEWLADQGLDQADESIGAGASIVVGSTNFYEQEILAELYAGVLEANGFEVERRFQLGAREVVVPALESGEIDLIAEYAATALEFFNEGAGEATPDAAETAGILNERIAERGLTALEAATATNQNAIVVTRETADQYGLSAISDLAQPAP